MTTDEPWGRLADARVFELQVVRAAGVLRGIGVIAVESTDPAALVWHEEGEWIDGALAGIRFRNTTRWERLDAGAIRVGHHRRGPAPVFLSILRPAEAGQWLGEVHPCGDDRYHPTLDTLGEQLVIRWEVTSPTDPYQWTMRVSG